MVPPVDSQEIAVVEPFPPKGEDAESIRLENSTWADLNVVMTRMIMMFIVISCLQVAEKLSKYCILLHILEGSTEASHFSAICILCLNNVS
ncbi:hypothetical protein CK203_086977 [Vitis vinifera]|uniref:Uncharacterized protein n=1 Tax=Vitis vinifera TaxID=29760 RepID=A0A438FIY2_VITVI|nr:hypothetical protein CK203_086977 [Vitis vinifera]